MWWDEMIVPLMSRYSLAYIMRWAQVFEPNPPYFHLFIKLIAWISPSDAFLRLGPAVAGTVSVGLVYVAGKRLINPGTGLASAAFLAINPLHILMSRQVRPYTMVLMLLICSFILLFQFIADQNKNRALWGNVVCNTLALSLHYSALLFLMAQALPLWARAIWRRTRPDTLGALKHSFGLVLAFLPVAPFFIPTVFARQDMVNAATPFSDLALRTLKLVPQLFVYFDGFVPGVDGLILWSVAVLTVLGMWRIFLQNIFSLGLLLSLAVTPVAIIIIFRSNFLFARYIFFVFIPCSLFMAAGLDWILRTSKATAVVALLLAVTGGLYIPEHFHQQLYSQDSFNHFGPGGTYRQDSNDLKRMGEQNRFMVFTSEGLRQSLRWYLNPHLPPGPQDIQELTPKQSSVELDFITDDDFAQLAADEPSMLREFGQPLDVRHFHQIREYAWTVSREPVHHLDSIPAFYTFNAHPLNFIRNVASAHFAQVYPLWGNSIIPTTHGQPAVIEYSFTMPEGQYPYHVLVETAFANTGQGNLFRVYAIFDDQQKLVYANTGPDRQGSLTFHLFRDAPFKRFSLRLEMTCSPQTPNYCGSNLDTIQVREVVVGFVCNKPVETPP
jgi:hypothetical protein